MAEKDKKKTVAASESTRAEAELGRLVREHRLVWEVLREHESLIKIAIARNSKLEKAKLLEEIVTRERELSSRISELRKKVKPRPHGQIMYGPWPEPLPTRDPTPWDAWLPNRWRYARVLGPQLMLPCPAMSGLSVADPGMSYSELSTPQFPTTDALQDMTRITDAAWDGISFKDCFVDVTQSQIFIADGISQAGRLDFAFPPAPCDGTLTYELWGQLAGGPVIEPNNPGTGVIIADVRALLHVEGDTSVDPDDYSYGSGYLPRGWIFAPLDLLQQSKMIDHSDSIPLQEGERALLHVAAVVSMSVSGGMDWGGRSSFADIESAIGHVIVTTPPSAVQPGVVYDFAPTP